MNMIEFARSEDGTYIIVEDNDERLFCIGQLLADDAIRSTLANALSYAPEIGLEKHLDIETKLYKIRVSPTSQEMLYIKLHDKSNAEFHLETDISVDSLTDLIENWEDALVEDAQSITITRVQDTFFLETA